MTHTATSSCEAICTSRHAHCSVSRFSWFLLGTVLEKIAPSSSSDPASKSVSKKVSRKLFPARKKKIAKRADEARAKKTLSLARKFVAGSVPAKTLSDQPLHSVERPSLPESSSSALVLVEPRNLSLIPIHPRVPILTILEISESCPRFAFEGKILSRYGTYKYDTGPKILKSDLTDAESCDTITLVIAGNSLFRQFEKKIAIGDFIHVEGPVVRKKHQNDGGSALLSLHLDATSMIIKAEPFDVCLSFIPDVKIHELLSQSTPLVGPKTLFGTIAFVVLEVEKTQRNSGDSAHQFIIADGPTNLDRTTLSFVNDRKDDANALAGEFATSGRVMYVARNVGVWLKQSNTLSVLDFTLLTRVTSEGLRAELEAVLSHQIAELGLANEISGILQVVNVNSVLLEHLCRVCCGSRITRQGDVAYYQRCSKNVTVLQSPCLQVKITPDYVLPVNATLAGSIIDKVLCSGASFVAAYNQDVLATRRMISTLKIVGSFVLNHLDHVVGFKA